MNKIIFGDNINALDLVSDESVRLIYLDSPFDTGKVQKLWVTKSISSEDGNIGFCGKKYQSEKTEGPSYIDSFDNFEDFLMVRIEKALKKITNDGSIFIHLDFRQSHYIKVAMDKLMGKGHFINEIIWSFDYGAKSKVKYSNKHNTIFWYAKNPKQYIFNYSDIDRVPYLAPDLVSNEKARLGKVITTVWWNTIVPTNGKERVNYPSQKPLGILNRIVKMHSLPGDCVLDIFAGSGSTAEAAGNLGRKFIMIDNNIKAIHVMKKRLERFNPLILDEKGNEYNM